MDNEEARFILRSFRPDGADGSDPEFAEALRLAVENRELGEWLASERAFDAAFARALGSVDLPENLRADIFACLAGERTDFPQAEDAFDAAFIGTLATIQAPPGLREAVIAAMVRTAVPAPAKLSIFRRAAIPLAAAAGIALGFIFTRPAESVAVAVAAESAALGIDAVQAGFVRTFESPSFALDEKREDPGMLVRHLRKRKLPCPGRLPHGLREVKSIGCRELVIDGKRGSLVCFDLREDGIVHMVIFRRQDVRCELPSSERPQFVQRQDWAAARWSDKDKVFLILGHTDVEKLAALF